MGNSKSSDSYEKQENKKIKWYWFDKDKRKIWLKLSKEDNKNIEIEYQDHLSKKIRSPVVYHCFGNGFSAGTDFNRMETYCSTTKCKHRYTDEYKEDHMTYKLKRITE